MRRIHTSITKREITQKNRQGKTLTYDRYILHYRDAGTGKRRMGRFRTRKEAEQRRVEIITGHDKRLGAHGKEPPTLRGAADYWLASRACTVQPNTYRNYKMLANDYIVGPFLIASKTQRRWIALTGKVPKDAQYAPMFGPTTKIEDVTTAQIRAWHQKVVELSGTYTGKAAKKALSSIFRLIEEDYGVRLARMPSRSGAPHRRKQRRLLSEEEAQRILEEAQRDKQWGVYYAFPILTGVRPNEQLALLWENVDFERRRIRICQTQRDDGSVKEFTKTEAGMRDIPINSILLEMLKEWKERCPRDEGEPHRVFPGQGFITKKGEHVKGGRVLTLSNFRMRVWRPLFDDLGIPHATIYAARHMMISHLQAQGVPVGVVAKIAGHANPQVTLTYYTHAVSEIDGVMDQLNAAYGMQKSQSANGSSVQLC